MFTNYIIRYQNITFINIITDIKNLQVLGNIHAHGS